MNLSNLEFSFIIEGNGYLVLCLFVLFVFIYILVDIYKFNKKYCSDEKLNCDEFNFFGKSGRI